MDADLTQATSGARALQYESGTDRAERSAGSAHDVVLAGRATTVPFTAVLAGLQRTITITDNTTVTGSA
jgi:hypothetical protein